LKGTGITRNAKTIDLNSVGLDESTALHLSVKEGYKNISEYLLDKGAIIECRNNFLQTPLHLSCMRGDAELFNLLLSRNANILAKDSNGNTPLHLLASYGYLNLIKHLLLLPQSAIASKVKNNSNKLPIDLTTNPKVKELLEQIAVPRKDMTTQKIHIHSANQSNNVISTIFAKTPKEV
jgi:ankyrin repeat protein